MPESKPAKEAVREYLEKRVQSDQPPPTPDEVRRQLGWHWHIPQDAEQDCTR